MNLDCLRVETALLHNLGAGQAFAGKMLDARLPLEIE
jgi:hypothetical protein